MTRILANYTQAQAESLMNMLRNRMSELLHQRMNIIGGSLNNPFGHHVDARTLEAVATIEKEVVTTAELIEVLNAATAE